MKSVFNRLSILATASALVLTQVIMPVHAAFATQYSEDPAGANGTLKVHELGTTTETPSNEPIVCTFNFEGFGFDAFQEGYIEIEAQGGDDPTGEYVEPIIVGNTDTSGNFETTPYFNNGGNLTIKDGHYKATLFGSKQNKQGKLELTKIKSKVFKVDCGTSTTPNNVTAVNGVFSDTCGAEFNLTFTPAVTEGVQYTQTRTGNTITVKASVTDSAKYTITNPDWSQSATDKLIPCETPAPTIKPCTTIEPATVNKYEDFADYNDTRATGHAEFVEDGLHIWTEGTTSTDKVAWYNSVTPYSLAEIGTPSMDYTNTAGGVPGMQIALDKDGDGIKDAILVGEPASYGDKWWSSTALGVTSGMGYASFATLQAYLTANPNAKVVAVGFSLGSGVRGDGVLHSLTFGCVTWTFKKAPHVAKPCTVKDKEFTKEWTYNDSTMPEAGAFPDTKGALLGKYEFVNNELFTGIRLTTPAEESYVDGLIDAGHTSILDVDAMSYTTYRSPSSTGISSTLPSYVLEVDKDGNLATKDTAYLFYEPYYNGTVSAGTWQTWDAISAGSAKWWMTGTGQALHTWNEFKASMPDAVILGYGFNQGTSNAGADTYIKSMTFDCATTTFSTPGKGGVDVTPTPTPTPTPVVPATPSTPKTSTTNPPMVVAGKGSVMPSELPETGASFSPLLIGGFAAAIAYGAIYFAQPKRFYE